jgi:hypothetical protein
LSTDKLFLRVERYSATATHKRDRNAQKKGLSNHTSYRKPGVNNN